MAGQQVYIISCNHRLFGEAPHCNSHILSSNFALSYYWVQRSSTQAASSAKLCSLSVVCTTFAHLHLHHDSCWTCQQWQGTCTSATLCWSHLPKVRRDQALSTYVKSHEGLDGDDPDLAQNLMRCHGDCPQTSHHWRGCQYDHHGWDITKWQRQATLHVTHSDWICSSHVISTLKKKHECPQDRKLNSYCPCYKWMEQQVLQESLYARTDCTIVWSEISCSVDTKLHIPDTFKPQASTIYRQTCGWFNMPAKHPWAQHSADKEALHTFKMGITCARPGTVRMSCCCSMPFFSIK